jgi:hypothetical protein
MSIICNWRKFGQRDGAHIEKPETTHTISNLFEPTEILSCGMQVCCRAS